MEGCEIRRGDIFYIYRTAYMPSVGSEQMAGRPGIIVSNDKANSSSQTVEVVYLTTQPKTNLPTHVTIRSTGRESTALCEQITTVSKDRIGNFVCHISETEMTNLETAMLISLDLVLGNVVERIVEAPANPKEVRAKNDGENCGGVLVALQTERDTYKLLYEQLLDRIIKAG